MFYTTDSTQRDRDWVVEDVNRGDRLSITIKDLSPETTYYFKVQARNSVGSGPSSPTIIFRTPKRKLSMHDVYIQSQNLKLHKEMLGVCRLFVLAEMSKSPLVIKVGGF